MKLVVYKSELPALPNGVADLHDLRVHQHLSPFAGCLLSPEPPVLGGA